MSRPAGSDGPEDVDATFEEIVADLRASGFGDLDTATDDTDNTDGTAGTASPEAGDGRGADLTDRGASGTSSGTGEKRDDDAAGEPRPARGWRGAGTSWEDTILGGGASTLGDASDDEHYVPPEAPPLPKPRKGAFIVLLFFVVGLLLLIAPQLLGISGSIATPLGLLALAIAIALLLLRVKQGPPDGADPSDGSQV